MTKYTDNDLARDIIHMCQGFDSVNTRSTLVEMIKAVRAEERKRCANECEEYATCIPDRMGVCEDCALIIRGLK